MESDSAASQYRLKTLLALDIINDNDYGRLLLSTQHVDVALAWNLFVSSVRQSFLHENPWPGLPGLTAGVWGNLIQRCARSA